MKPKIAITIGDVAGIGPEIVRKALISPRVHRVCIPVVIGDPRVVTVKPGLASAGAGKYAMACVKEAVELALQKKVDAIVTAPISKEGIHKAGFRFEGHTDYLAHLTGTKEYSMMLVSPQLRVVLVTIHLKLKEVARKITRKGVVRAIRHADLAGHLLKIRKPRIVVCALNPHGAETGSEEKKIIIPAVKKAEKEGLDVKGPFPADTLFHRVLNKEFDIVVAMYHDQGLSPLKMLGFEQGINVTLGLPIIRTSPDHGTAYDIAGKGKADPTSMLMAIELAARMAHEIR